MGCHFVRFLNPQNSLSMFVQFSDKFNAVLNPVNGKFTTQLALVILNSQPKDFRKINKHYQLKCWAVRISPNCNPLKKTFAHFF